MWKEKMVVAMAPTLLEEMQFPLYLRGDERFFGDHE
jgi:hypothetical protein